ncbi:hypothetical protein FHR83_008665 [Actinoplanes campanulatus]|uniref:Fibronectin type III domain-containing protein n=1 Tax=Actinoplanes campanulatus TaxID=113559 RepID=A0A7W5AR55_9ACTN|nr:cellulose binding domain-containing protein [Actinoplanes campanulatus]MBB3100938.1 hypothetical protein [Actinoplanes campanulatus]GGN48837.1 hypothetical protein GCM10010109_86280 [Actinoplanes campanulatus]GID41754.1 hypothetical protein Aca09nite_82600 [Actinoplanes campanulatus]
MPRHRLLWAATFLAAATTLLALTGPAVAAPTPTPVPTPTAAPTTPPPPRPAPPTDLRVTAVTPTSVTLSWTASTGGLSNVVGYSVNYYQAFNDIYWAQPVDNVTTVTVTSSISPTRQYTFSVFARSADGQTSTSTAPVTVVTPAVSTGDTTPPSAPSGLAVGAVTEAGAELSWSPSTDDTAVTGYQVYWFDGWFTSVLVGTATGTTFIAQSRPGPGPRPSFYVRAKDAAGNLSIASNLVAAPVTTTPPPPRICRVAYRTTTEWTGGFVAEVTVTNTGTTAVDDWSLAVSVGGDQQITSAWHATVRQDGPNVTLTAAHWNRTIPPGGSVTAGLTGRWSASNALPVSASLNGNPCTLA